MPRVLDRRVRYVVGQGAASKWTTTMPDVAVRWLCSLLGTLGGARGIFRQEILYLGRAGSVIHLGCCHTPGAAGAGTKFFDNAS